MEGMVPRLDAVKLAVDILNEAGNLPTCNSFGRVSWPVATTGGGKMADLAASKRFGRVGSESSGFGLPSLETLEARICPGKLDLDFRRGYFWSGLLNPRLPTS